MTHERQRGRGSPSTLTLLEYSFIIVTISRTPPALEPLNPQLHQYQLAYKEKKHYIGIEASKGLYTYTKPVLLKEENWKYLRGITTVEHIYRTHSRRVLDEREGLPVINICLIETCKSFCWSWFFY